MGGLRWRGEANPDRKAAALCSDLNRWWPALWGFARAEGVEPTNNVSERAMRPAVLWRTGSFGSDSEAGSRLAERLLTVVASCRRQGRQLLDFLAAGRPEKGIRPGRPNAFLLDGEGGWSGRP